MAAEVGRRLVRAGSLSSESESSSSSDSEGESGRRVRSAVVQVPSNHRKFHAPPESPHDAPSSRSPTDRHSSPPASESPHQLDFGQHRSPSQSPSPPLVSRKRDRRHSQSPSPPNNRRRHRSISKSPSRQRRRMLSNSPPMNRKRQRVPPDSRAQRRRRSSSPPLDRRGRSRPFHQSPPRSEGEEGEWVEGGEAPPPKKKKEEIDPILTRTGGAYIPPARLRMMQQSITDKSSVAYQRLSWEALKKSINGLVNKVNVSNIANIIQELFQENVVRGRGLLAQSVIRAQGSSPTFTHVYAGLVAIVNTKFPQTGELIARRLLVRFRKGFRRNDKDMCNAAVKFVAHLVNQQVLHELVALELLTLLLEDPTDDSVEVSIGFLKECGLKLTEVSPRGVHAVFETLRSILHSGKVTSRVQYMVEVMFAIRKDKFKEHPTVIDGLDLVQEEDQITHLLSLSDDFDTEDLLNVFHPDPDFVANEEKYRTVKAEILGEDEEGSSSGESGEGSSEEESEEEGEEEEEGAKGIDMTDMTDAKVLAIRRQIYLTIMSSLDYEECAHKLLKNMEEGQEREIAHMLVEVCSQERSYLRFYGLLGQRFCQLNQIWVEMFDGVFQEQYSTVHRLETNKLRNVAKFFAQLFYGDALPWTCMSCIHLNEEETNSSSRIFVKILFQELAEFMGMSKLNERLRDPLLSLAFEGLLPRDNPKNTRFAINFFTSIGLGGLTDDLREHLKNAQKLIMAQHQEVSSSDVDSDSSDSSEDSSDSSTEDESSSVSSSSSSEEEQPPRRHRKRREEPKHHARRRSRDKEEVREKQHRSKKREEGKREDRRRQGREEEMEVEREEERSGRSKGDERGKEREHDRRDNGRDRRAERDDKRRDKHGRESRRDRDGEDEDEREGERKRARKVEGRDGDEDESGRERRRDRVEDESGRERRRDRDEDESGRERRRDRDDESRRERRKDRDDESRRERRRDRDEYESEREKRRDGDEDESGRERRRDRDEDESGREKRRDRDEDESGREKRRDRDEDESGREKRRDGDEDESGRERRRDRDKRGRDGEDVRRRNEGRDRGRDRSERGARRERDEDTREQHRERKDRRRHNHRGRED